MAETETSSYNKRRNLQSKNENSNNNGEEDRLSSLPDTLLLEILSLLPLKSAAATSVLSHLWTHLTHLTFDGDNPPWLPYNADSLSRTRTFFQFKDIVYHILAQITSPHIQSLNLFIPDPGARPKLCTKTLESLISLIFTRNVATIKVILDPSSDLTRGVYLPSCIFEIQSLVELQLGGSLHCKLPELTDGVVSLPNLKKLELGANIHFNDLEKLWAFINSCPLLELLSLEFDIRNADVVIISLPMLKSLIIYSVVSRSIKFVIDTPMLEHLLLHAYFGYYSFDDYPTKLLRAELSILGIRSCRTDKFGRMLPLLQRISGVKSVCLGEYMDFFNALNYLDVDVRSIFCNVTHLRLNGDFIGGGFDVQNPIPLFLFSKLKKLEIHPKRWNANNVRLLDYILSDANVLGQLCALSIYTNSDNIEDDDSNDIYDDHDDDNSNDEDCNKDILWWEYKVYKTLLAVSKGSLPSQFEFVGTFIRVSSDCSQNGLIVTFKN